jgi:type IV secretory pathway VirB4 component
MSNTVAENAKASQEFVPIKEIRDGVVILKDNSMRALVMASSINFALKSNDEQQGILMQFQNFVNSLNFSVELFVQSRRLDIRPYLALLESRYVEQTSELLKIQTREYIGFIKSFTETTSVMTKTFYVVVPYSPPLSFAKDTHIENILKSKSPTKEEKKKSDTEYFEEARTQLEQRINVVEQGLIRCGIRVAQLGTEELVEVFYKLFNPGDVNKPIINQN